MTTPTRKVARNERSQVSAITIAPLSIHRYRTNEILSPRMSPDGPHTGPSSLTRRTASVESIKAAPWALSYPRIPQLAKCISSGLVGPTRRMADPASVEATLGGGWSTLNLTKERAAGGRPLTRLDSPGGRTQWGLGLQRERGLTLSALPVSTFPFQFLACRHL